MPLARVVPLLVGAVVLLAADAAAARWLVPEVDRPLLSAAVGARTPATDRVARLASDIGSPVAMTAVAAVVVLVLLVARRHRSAAGYAVAAAAGGELSPLLKTAVGRPRPPVLDRLVAVSGSAFPSGHALGTTVVLGLLVLVVRDELVVRRAPGGRRRLGAAALPVVAAAAVVLTVAVGSSRVWLGVHWPTDVVAGWCLGVSWVCGCALAAGLIRRRRR